MFRRFIRGCAVLVQPLIEHYNCLTCSRLCSRGLPHWGACSLQTVLSTGKFFGGFPNIKKELKILIFLKMVIHQKWFYIVVVLFCFVANLEGIRRMGEWRYPSHTRNNKERGEWVFSWIQKQEDNPLPVRCSGSSGRQNTWYLFISNKETVWRPKEETHLNACPLRAMDSGDSVGRMQKLKHWHSFWKPWWGGSLELFSFQSIPQMRG